MSHEHFREHFVMFCTRPRGVRKTESAPQSKVLGIILDKTEEILLLEQEFKKYKGQDVNFWLCSTNSSALFLR